MRLLGNWEPYGGVTAAELDLLANRVLVVSMALLLIPLVASLYRATTSGWLPLYAYQTVVYGVGLTVALLRRRIDGRVKVLVIIVGCLFVFLAGHFSNGLFKGGAFYLPIALILTVFFFGPSQLFALFLVAAFGYIFIAVEFMIGNLQSDLRLDQVNQDVSYWINTGVSLLAFFVISSLVMSSYRKMLTDKYQEAQSQRDEIERLTKYCSLTGAGLLVTATERLSDLLAAGFDDGEEGALLLVVIENLAEINNEQGYDIGEMALRQTAERLQGLLRPDDFLARVGGSRFLLILPRVKSDNRADFLAEQIQRQMQAPVKSAPQRFTIKISIGITRFPVQALDAKQLILRVNEAAQAARRDQVGVFRLL